MQCFKYFGANSRKKDHDLLTFFDLDLLLVSAPPDFLLLLLLLRPLVNFSPSLIVSAIVPDLLIFLLLYFLLDSLTFLFLL